MISTPAALHSLMKEGWFGLLAFSMNVQTNGFLKSSSFSGTVG